MRKLRGSAYSLILVIGVMVTVIASSLRFEYFADKLLPLIVGSAVLLLAVIALLKEIKTGKHIEEATALTDETGGEEKANVELAQYIPIAAWIMGLSISIYVFGFIISTLLFVGAYMKRHGSNWPVAVLSAAIFTGIIYVVFNVVLMAELHRGHLLMRLGF